MKEKIDDYLQDFYTVDQNYNTITMMKEKKNMVVTYRKGHTTSLLVIFFLLFKEFVLFLLSASWLTR